MRPILAILLFAGPALCNPSPSPGEVLEFRYGIPITEAGVIVAEALIFCLALRIRARRAGHGR